MKNFYLNKDILDLFIEGIVILDLNCKVVYCNRLASSVLKKLNLIEFCKTLSFFKLTKKSFYDDDKNVYFDIIAFKDSSKIALILQDKSCDYKALSIGRDFVSNASHELKTPLTIIKGFAETLENFSIMSEDIIKDIVNKIIKTSKRLENIIKDLLMLADIDNAHLLQMKSCDLSQVILNTREMILYSNKNVEIDMFFEDNFFILAEEYLLELAMKNLLENAVCYCQKNPKIKVQLIKVDNCIKCSIQDNGIGIDDKDLPYIFDRFYTVDKARSRKTGGTGLGLSLVKNIIEKHNGNIKVSSKINSGSLFEITFPCMDKAL